VRHWIAFAGLMLVIVMLDWAEPVLLPFAIALLLTFLLNPLVTWLERWMRRTLAVLAVVLLTTSVLGLLTYGLFQQVSGLAGDLPTYRATIREKIADIRGASQGGSLEEVQQTLDEIQREMEGPDARAQAPVAVAPAEPAPSPWGVPPWFSALLAPLGMAGLVAALAIFMLLEHRELRDRFVGLVGYGHVATTTKAFDEAGMRVSRYLLMQTLVNLIYGAGVGIGLWLLGVPYPLLWASMGAALRFIPYVGPLLAAGAPILVSLATLPGWTRPLAVVGLFIGLELFTNLVLETVLYAGAAGISQVALLVAVAFWTWLWGALGLLLATPLTVCLVVLGKHVPGLHFISTLMADTPSLNLDARYYQRLLARDPDEALDLVEEFLEEGQPEQVFDAVVIPALAYAARDRRDGRLSTEEERRVVQTTHQMIDDIASRVRMHPRDEGAPDSATAPGSQPPAVGQPVRVLGYPANGEIDEAALRVLSAAISDLPIALEIASEHMMTSDLLRAVREKNYAIVCAAAVVPGPASRVRYTVKRLRHETPDLKILVCRWGPADLAGEADERWLDVGATRASSSILQTREHLRAELAPHIVDASAVPA
jgi:predicted PurR-regulated permease PerM